MILQQEFERRATELDARSKSTPRQRLDLLQQLLDGVEEAVRGREIARLTSKPSNSQFDDLMAQAFVERLLKSGDLKSLEHLLAMNCPEYVAAIPLEFVLARSKQPDAILVLPHAYSTDATNAAIKVALRCLVRAFPLLRQSGQSDKSFAATCETWWAANRLRCVVNFEYPHLPGRPAPAPDQNIPPEESGLFLRKE